MRGQVAAYTTGWSVVKRLPEPVGWPMFAAAVTSVTMRNGKGVRRLRANLARVTGKTGVDLERLVHDGMRSYARYWYDVFRLPTYTDEQAEAAITVAFEERIFDAYEQGRGVILVLAHLGNWDIAGRWLVGRGIPFTTVAERLEPAALFDKFVSFRTALGMEVIALTGGEQPPFETLASRLRDGKMLCLLADRDLSRHGVPVQFFGATATMPAGPAKLALETGAILLPTTVWYERDWSLSARIDAAIPHTDVVQMTQQVADCFARTISAHPNSWHMLQRLWRE